VSVRFAKTTEPIVEDIRRMLLAELQSARTSISLTEEDGLIQDDSEISLTRVGEALVRKLARKERGTIDEDNRQDMSGANSKLPKLITFPYSRHSSCSELQHLVGIFKPKDVFPCTVDEENWHEGKPLIILPAH
jgi:DNA cross-link repair 1C protein